MAVSLSQNGRRGRHAVLLQPRTPARNFPMPSRVCNTPPAAAARRGRANRSCTTPVTRTRERERPEADANFYQQVYRHELGHDPKGRCLRHRQRTSRASPKSRWKARAEQHNAILAAVGQWPTVASFAHYLLPPTIFTGSPQFIEFRDGHATKETPFPFNVPDNERTWRQITRFEDKVKGVRLGWVAELYLLSVKDAPHGRGVTAAVLAARR